MTEVREDDQETETNSRAGIVRIVQSVGAVIATAFVLWFLFGVPAYILFGSLFD